MNLNQSQIQKKKVRNGFGFSASNIKQIMGPPCRPPPKAASSRQKSSSTASSRTNWGKNYPSILNTPTLRSASTTISADSEARVIAALTEGRGDARCEVGLASIDLSMPTLILCQISDSQSYINTLTKINILNPTDIIVPTTFLETDNRLIAKIRKKFPNIKILGIPRKAFHKSNGMDRILNLCLPSINTICVGLQHKYYALAAASALTTYLQNNLNIYYAKESINVSYQESEGYAIIDVSTADLLELVSSTKPAQATRFSTLFGVLNHCVTKVGARLLRSTILQPPSTPSIIERTSQCVAELIKHPEVLLSIQAILQKVSNIDQLLSLTSMMLGTSDGCSVRQLNYLLLLNSLIDLIEPLKDVIDKCQQPFFKELKGTLESDHFVVIADKIRTMIHPSAHFAKSEAGVAQRCFAIKSDINGLLDLVRKTYSERLNDLTEYVKHLGNKYGLSLILGNNNIKGYHIILKLTNQQKRTYKKSDLPPEFIQVYRLAGSCTMKTAELINYSTRLEDIMLEILKISNSMIYNIVIDLKQYLGFFYKLCEDVARLDMLQSLAEASRRGNYVRPKFGDFTELVNSRHPMLEKLIGQQRVANPISICQDFNIQVITGPNGSGKSVYIRQVMLLQIMAQVGCYVPADSAVFRPMSRMFARIYLEDDIEHGASSFILEVKEVKYMMTLVSDNSLFIIDELCRSTAANEGAALAMAICEKFCSSPTFFYITTHYTSLASLADMHLNVKTWHMETLSTGDTPQELILDFRFRLIPGVTNLRHYGVYIVKKIWSESILNEVYRILEKFKKSSVERRYVGVIEPIRLKYKLESDLRKLKSLGKLTKATINKLLNDYQNELQKMNAFISLSLSEQDRHEVFRAEHLLEYENGQSTDEEGSVLAEPHLFPDGLHSKFANRENSFEDNVYNEAADFNDEDDEHQLYEDAFETSSYKHLSNFLHEDSDNINKLIPEVTLACSEREFFLAEGNDSEPKGSTGKLMTLFSQPNTDGGFEIVESVSKSTSGATRSCTKISEEANKWGTNIQNLSDSERKSVMEEFEIASRSFLEDDDFGFSQASSYQTASNEVTPDNNKKCEHICPVVTVIEGPAWLSDSSESNSPKRNENVKESESITYSPLCSQSSRPEAEKTSSKSSGQVNKTSSSSLHFITRNGMVAVETSENIVTTDTNGNISILHEADNITIENLKSVSSSEKPVTSDEQAAKMPTLFSPKEHSKIDSDPKEPNKNIYFKKRPKKFIVPRKLTRKEIQEEFAEQDRRLYESDMSESEVSKYLEQKFNRPSVKQLQNSKHLAFVRKTSDGVEVIPAQPEPIKRKFPFKRNLSSNNNIDMTIFSDKNAKCFEEFLNSDERDVKRFKFNFDSGKQSRLECQEFHFKPQRISEYAAAVESAPFVLRSQTSEKDEQFHSFTPMTPDGYYKQNKDEINDIVNKYLPENGSPEDDFQRNGLSNDLNIFETCSLNENDLVL